MSMLEPEAEPRVRRTIYPVSTVSSTGDVWPFGKLVITTDRAYLFVPGPAGNGVDVVRDALIVSAQLAEPWKRRGAVSTVTLPSETLTVTDLGGCGCQSSLKHHRPFDTRPLRTI